MHVGAELSLPTRDARDLPRPQYGAQAAQAAQQGVDPFEVRAGGGRGATSAAGEWQAAASPAAVQSGSRQTAHDSLRYKQHIPAPPLPPPLSPQGLPFRNFAERLGARMLPTLEAAKAADRAASAAARRAAEEAEPHMPEVPHVLPFTRMAAHSTAFRSTFIADPPKQRKKARLSWCASGPPGALPPLLFGAGGRGSGSMPCVRMSAVLRSPLLAPNRPLPASSPPSYFRRYHPDDTMVPRDWFSKGLLEDIKYYAPFGLGGGSSSSAPAPEART